MSRVMASTSCKIVLDYDTCIPSIHVGLGNFDRNPNTTFIQPVHLSIHGIKNDGLWFRDTVLCPIISKKGSSVVLFTISFHDGNIGRFAVPNVQIATDPIEGNTVWCTDDSIGQEPGLISSLKADFVEWFHFPCHPL